MNAGPHNTSVRLYYIYVHIMIQHTITTWGIAVQCDRLHGVLYGGHKVSIEVPLSTTLPVCMGWGTRPHPYHICRCDIKTVEGIVSIHNTAKLMEVLFGEPAIHCG